MRRTLGLTTRSLMACVVLGAFTALLVHAARWIGLAVQATVPWLAFPAPVPWFLGIIVAALLIPRAGAALITSVIGAVAGFGWTALVAGILIEAVFWIVRRSRRGEPALVLSRRDILAALITGLLLGLMNVAFMFVYQEFRLMDDGVKVLAVAARLVLGVLYALLAIWITRLMVRAGIDPEGLAAQDEFDEAPEPSSEPV